MIRLEYSGDDPIRLEKELLDVFKTNTVGNIHLINLFMPLILKGNAKKVITVSSGMADMETTRKFNIFQNAPYSISKAAVNMVMSKFSAEYSKDEVLFLSICPGVVDTGHYADCKLSQNNLLRRP